MLAVEMHSPIAVTETAEVGTGWERGGEGVGTGWGRVARHMQEQQEEVVERRSWNKVDRDGGWGYGRPCSILRRKGADRAGPHAERSEGRESCQTGRRDRERRGSERTGRARRRSRRESKVGGRARRETCGQTGQEAGSGGEGEERTEGGQSGGPTAQPTAGGQARSTGGNGGGGWRGAASALPGLQRLLRQSVGGRPTTTPPRARGLGRRASQQHPPKGGG